MACSGTCKAILSCNAQRISGTPKQLSQNALPSVSLNIPSRRLHHEHAANFCSSKFVIAWSSFNVASFLFLSSSCWTSGFFFNMLIGESRWTRKDTAQRKRHSTTTKNTERKNPIGCFCRHLVVVVFAVLVRKIARPDSENLQIFCQLLLYSCIKFLSYSIIVKPKTETTETAAGVTTTFPVNNVAAKAAGQQQPIKTSPPEKQ